MNDIDMQIKNFYGITVHPEKLLNNCVNPELGLHIFNTAMKLKTQIESKNINLFDI